MSVITQEPIFEDVCTATERKIVGWRDADGSEQALEEQFSSGVPAVIGGELDTAALTWPDGSPPPGFTLPGFVGGPVPPIDTAAIPIPAAGFLLVGAIAVAYAIKQLRNRA